MIVIEGGEVLTTQGWRTADVAIESGVVTAIGDGLAGDESIEAKGCLVGPGFVDMHTHLREPGHTWKEDIASGAAAAAAGGFTAITAMPNTDPPVDSPKLVDSTRVSATGCGVEVIVAASLTVARAGARPVDVAELYRAGVRLFTDDGDSVADSQVLEHVMREVSAHPGAFVAQHAEEVALTSGSHLHEGTVSRRLGIPGMPTEAESRVVERDLELAATTGARYHCQHVSAKMTVDLIRRAKERGMHVTAEVTPHHLSFDEWAVEGLDPNFKMYPPLRSAQDRASLLEAVRDGVIDAVATDHAPHLPGEKAVGFAEAPRGVIGLETAAAAVWELLADPDLLFERLSLAPARILGLETQGRALHEGAPANIVVFDPDANWTASEFRSRSSNSPFLGRQMRGRVVATIFEGVCVGGAAA